MEGGDKPMTDMCTGTGKGAACDDQGPNIGPALKHGLARRRAHHGAVQIVGIILRIALARMDDTGINGLVAERTSSIGNLIRRREQIPIRQTSLLALGVPTLHARPLTVLFRCTLGWLEASWESGDLARRLTNSRGSRGKVVLRRVRLRVPTGPGAEVGSFVHVDPETIDVNAILVVEEPVEFAVPVCLGVGVEPVGEHGHARPDSAYTWSVLIWEKGLYDIPS